MRYKSKYFARLGTAVLIFVVPLSVQAACSANGYSVVFINGVNNTRDQAEESRRQLEFKIGSQFNGESIIVKLGYNQTHWQGMGDVIEAYLPIFDAHDLNTILMQIQPEVRTRKLFIVGHSQGAMYANRVYEYLSTHGVSTEAMGVYGVGTPDSYVAGGGKYLTYSLDPIINDVRFFAKGMNPLPANIHMIDLSPNVPVEGHSFIGQYLAGAGDRIKADIQSGLLQLKPTGARETGNCFEAPSKDLSYKVQDVALIAGEPVAIGIKITGQVTYAAGSLAVSAVGKVVAAVGSVFSPIIGFFNNPKNNPAAPENQDKNFLILKQLYGSSIDNAALKELHGENPNQAASAVLALAQPAPKKTVVAETVTSDELIWLTPDPVATSTPLEPEAEPATTTPTTTPYKIGYAGWATNPVPAGGGSSSSSSSASSPTLFSATTTAPTLTVTECSSSSSTTACVINTTSVNLSWTSVTGATSYGVSVNGSETQTTTGTTASLTLTNLTSTTLAITAYDTNSTATTSASQVVYVYAPLSVLNIHDTFNTFDTSVWHGRATFQNFMLDDGSGGACRSGGCAVEGTDTGTVPQMYAELSSGGLTTGSFTVWAKGVSGGSSGDPTPVIMVCEAGSSCVGASIFAFSGTVGGVQVVPLDSTWRQYYIAWKQTGANVEKCILADDTNVANCTWIDTGVAAGSTYSGVVLGSQSAIRSDLGAHLYFDDLSQ